MILPIIYLISLSFSTSIYFIGLYRINRRYNRKLDYFSEAYKKLESDYLNLLLERGDNIETVIFRDGGRKCNSCECYEKRNYREDGSQHVLCKKQH